MTIDINNLIHSAAFWTAIAGAAAAVCGGLGLGSIAVDVQNVLLAVGGLLIATSGGVTTHHQQKLRTLRIVHAEGLDVPKAA